MKKLWLVAIGLVIGLTIGLPVGYGVSVVSQEKPSQTASAAPTVAELLSLVNAERAKNGVAPLKEDVRLNASAQMKANDEVAYNYFGHENPHDGKHGYEYINSVGISCKTDSENLVQNIDPATGETFDNTSKGTIDAWLISPAHHAAMVDPKYSLTGFGINGNQVVEHFCQAP